MRSATRHALAWLLIGPLLTALALLFLARIAEGRPTIRASFFSVYPGAVGTRLDNLPSISGHCGVCHYRFTGGSTRNPYGFAIEGLLSSYPNTDAGRQQLIATIQAIDQDGDGYTSLTEITNLASFANTPTFPGLTAGNAPLATNVDPNDILGYLAPSTGVDTAPPTVTVTAPNGGESWTGGGQRTITWTASDNVAVTNVSVYYRDAETEPWTPIAVNIENVGAFTWFVHNTPTGAARVRVLARDAMNNQGTDESNGLFSILGTPGGAAPTTLRDFKMPGTQPFGGGTFQVSGQCITCHGGYDVAVEPGHNFKGTMMGQAARDPLFFACVAIAEQDAPSSGDLCLRCHTPFGWMSGRSNPTSGSALVELDRDGVACDHCHRMVDPIYKDGISPVEDQAVLTALTPSHVPSTYSNGQFVVDPDPRKRGPFADAVALHPWLVSAIHSSSDMCGTCHDVSNPVFNRVSGVDYAPGPLDQAAATIASTDLMPLERTYSEWKHSAFPAGVYAPDFAGNKPGGIVSTCQDCHMRDVSGQGANEPGTPVRANLPLHDMTGGNAWVPTILASVYPSETDAAALGAGAARAVSTLQKAAVLGLVCAVEGDSFRATVTVTNRTGHKLPTGYPEGRRMWLHIVARDDGGQVVYESGAYDNATGILSQTPEPVVYEVKLGISPALAAAINRPSGPSFHFALNDTLHKDNRIPPAGFTNAAFAAFGGPSVDPHFAGPGPRYADGQNWDVTQYRLPPTAHSVVASLYYQSTSKEYVEFLRDHNTSNAAGQTMHDLWVANGRAAPVLMERDSVTMGITAVESGEGLSPRLAVLRNPFDDALNLRVDLARPTRVTMQVFDVQGRRVARRDFGTMGGGPNRLVWNGRDDHGREARAGVYWAVVRAGDHEWKRQVIRVR